jgi:hypothetical protein
LCRNPAPENGNGGLSKLPLLNPPPSSHFWASDCTGHLGGCLLACAPDLFFQRLRCLYEHLPFFVFVRGFAAPFYLICCLNVVTWKNSPINTFSRH